MGGNAVLAGSWVVVTGASSGLGRTIAMRLAETYRSNLVLIGRRGELLESLATEVQGFGVKTHVVVLDLSAADAATVVKAEIDRFTDIAAVVLCAGVTYFGEATVMSSLELQGINTLNVGSTASLLQLFVTLFEERGVPGRILVVSSMSALIPLPFQAAYGASKSYIRSFVAALRAERPRMDVSITMAYPLGMDTDMTRGSGMAKLVERERIGSVSVTRCADRAISDLVRRRAVSLVGVSARLVYVLAMVVPGALLSRIAGRIYRVAWAEQKQAVESVIGTEASGAADRRGDHGLKT